MKNIQLKRLELTNYRNIEHAIYEFNGSSKIIGENRIGKTNTLEAIYYLLTNKLLDGSSDIAAIKPLKDTKLEVKVKAIFDIDGKEVTLEKDYKENWVKTRGTTNVEMKGHTITLLHNDVKQTTVAAYDQLVAEDFGFTQDSTTKIDFMQMLINPYYLGNVGESKDWTELRSFIIKLVGDVSDDDVAKTKPEFALIKKALDLVGGRVDQLKKKYSSEIDIVKTEIASDEAQVKLLQETPNPTDEEVAIAKKGVEEHQDKIAVLKSNNGLDVASMDISTKINEKRIELGELEKADLLKAQNSDGKKELREKSVKLHEEQSKLLNEKSGIRIAADACAYEKQKVEATLTSAQNYREDLIKKLKEIDRRIANPEVALECPTCHRKYDEADIEKAKATVVESLAKEKADLISKGKANKEKMAECEKAIESYDAKIKDYEDQNEKVVERLAAISKEITEVEAKLNTETPTIVANPRIATLKEEIIKLEVELSESREKYSKGTQDNQQKIYDEEQAMIPFKKVLSDREYYNRQMEQLASIKVNLTSHSKQLADLEQRKELINQFIYTKLKMLDDNVSKVFGEIKFQLIKENINGGFDTICKPYIYDTLKGKSELTSWRSGSKSERVLTGIAIVEAIKAKLNLPNLPYLFDEGGEISADTFATRFKTESQLICVKIADNITSPLVQKL